MVSPPHEANFWSMKNDISELPFNSGSFSVEGNDKLGPMDSYSFTPQSSNPSSFEANEMDYCLTLFSADSTLSIEPPTMFDFPTPQFASPIPAPQSDDKQTPLQSVSEGSSTNDLEMEGDDGNDGLCGEDLPGSTCGDSRPAGCQYIY
ncbi:hypothetical protein H4R33_003561 [Dimargaris cristalligena]|nr:hypothetical protein H4R33_003561 [Dimargaris cristalligena]